MPPRRTWWTFIAIVLVNYMAVNCLLRDEDPLMVHYTAFKAEVARGNVTRAGRRDRPHHALSRPLS